MIGRVGGAALTVALLAGGVHVMSPEPGAGDSARALPAYGAAGAAKPETPTLDELAAQIRRAERAVSEFERVGRRMTTWFACIKQLPVDQVGDRHHGWGFEYDERDGTGIDLRPALVIHRGSGWPDALLLRFSRTPRCVSRAPDPNGTGADARPVLGRGGPVRRGEVDRTGRLDRLEKRMRVLFRRLDDVDTKFSRFDQWESCLSWLPVTELGHEDQNLGFRFDHPGGPAGPQQHVAAVDIDTSEWDDPDYELLAFLGRDRPFRNAECGHDPGEGVDRAVTAAARRNGDGLDSVQERIGDLRRDLKGVKEDIEDLVEPVEEFVQFDECMYTVGMRNRGGDGAGYRFVRPDGTLAHRDALSFDLTGLRLPEMDIMAFSGEEPPQIECNEDAAGEFTDE